MDTDDEDLAEEIAHEMKLLKIYQKNLRHYRSEFATAGGKATVELKNNIEQHNELISNSKAEIARLKSRRAEVLFTGAEATYRRVLAEQLGIDQQEPRFITDTRREEMRIQLGITQERSLALEHEARSTLAKQILMSIAPQRIREFLLIDLCRMDLYDVMRTIGRSILLDPGVAAELFRSALVDSEEGELGLHGLREALYLANAVWPESADHDLFEEFFRQVAGGAIKIYPCRPAQQPRTGSYSFHSF